MRILAAFILCFAAFQLEAQVPVFITAQQNGQVVPVSNGGTLNFPAQAVGVDTAVQLNVYYQGLGTLTVGAPQVVGAAGFSIASVGTFPQTITAGGSLTFNIHYIPSDTGLVIAQFSASVSEALLNQTNVGSLTLLLGGLAPAFSISYSNSTDNNAQPIAAGGTIAFPVTALKANSTVTVVVANGGSGPGALSSVDLTGSAFQLVSLPLLPVTLNAGGRVSFQIQYSPKANGSASGQLTLGLPGGNTATFAVLGEGNAPAPLPAYQFQGPAGDVDPRQQPAIGLTLSQPYPLPLSGTLTLTTASSAFAADPAVLFSTGSAKVSFQIPANTTQAIFASGGTTIRLQTGTVQESIIVTPSFALSSGVDLTPASPPALTLTVPASAPLILQLLITSQTSNSFTLQVTGLATTRSLSQVTFQFNPTGGSQVAGSQASVDVKAAFDLWFQNQASQSFGGLFQFSVPFTLGGVPNGNTIAQYLSSVAVTLTNAVGTSKAVAVTF